MTRLFKASRSGHMFFEQVVITCKPALESLFDP